MTKFAPLPIDAALPDLQAALATRTAAVLVAPPGAGKTTGVPLVLAGERWVRGGKILVLEPRRLAARAAAERMAKTLGEAVGETVGYRVRFGTKVSKRTRIEVVTEGVFTGLILDDPSLEGVAAVLFDEFHERSLDADLGLALARDAQQGLREDLRLLVMSATIDGARIAKALGDAPVIASEGRAFAVETRYLGREAGKPIEPQVADAVARALRAEPGAILAFLPGTAEIRRTEALLRERITDPAVEIFALHGTLDFAAQDRAIAPTAPGRRKVVLATSIGETSLTIEGVRVVVDSGLARVPRYEPDVGLTRLETVRVSRAAADQRRGRAGRTEPGVCYRLWDEPQTAALEPFAQPEILAADLSPFVLDLAQWGVTDPGQLVFLDPPPAPAFNEARALLTDLGAIDASGRITNEGRLLARLPLPPRLARMVVDASREGTGRVAAEIAAVLTERGLGGTDIDLRHRIEGLRRDRSARAEEARRMAKRWAGMASSPSPRSQSAVADFDHDIQAPKPAYTRFRPGEARGGGEGDNILPENNRQTHPELPIGRADACERSGEFLPGFGDRGPRPWPRAGWGGAAPNLDPISVAGPRPHPAGAARRPPSPKAGRDCASASQQVSKEAAAATVAKGGPVAARASVLRDAGLRPAPQDEADKHPASEPSLGAILALAYPERIAKNRGAAAGAFLVANGRGAFVDPASPLAREPYLAVAELIGAAAQSRITLAAAIGIAEIETRFAGRIESTQEITCDPKTLALRGRRLRRLDAITLGDQPVPVTPDEGTARLLADAVAAAGVDRLPWSKALAQWRDRVIFLRRHEGEEWPDLSDTALGTSAGDWLAPLFFDKTALAALGGPEFEAALHSLLPRALRRRLEAEAPTHFDAPSGSRVPIDYEAEGGPKLAIRVQELFGLTRHPAIAGGRVPLLIELLSPAHRPVQLTRDLPGFWRGSYAAVKSEMRGRYPRHPWPDDPTTAPATRRAKPRGE